MFEKEFNEIAKIEREKGYTAVRGRVEALAEKIGCDPYDLMDYIVHEYGSGGYLFAQHGKVFGFEPFIKEMREKINSVKG